MFNIKNDDMDELFRKAAENYEVDTSKASRWDAVNNALRNVDDTIEEDEGKKKKKRRFFFWWFLFLPVILIAYYTWKKVDSNKLETEMPKTGFNKTTEAVNEKTGESNKPSANAIINNPDNTVEKALKRTSNNGDTVVGKNNGSNNLNSQNAVTNKKITAQNNPVANAIEHKDDLQQNQSSNKVALNNAIKGDDEKNRAEKHDRDVTLNNKHNNGFEKNKKVSNRNNQLNSIVVEKKKDLKNKAIAHRGKNGKDNFNNSGTINAAINTQDEYVGKTIAGNFQYVFTDYNGKRYTLMAFEKNISGIAPGIENFDCLTCDSSLQQNKKKGNGKRLNYFYLAAVVAPDLSSVKFQRVAGTGSSLGLLLGYRINKRWQIETGAMWEKKVYYTKGAYFDKSKLNPYLRDVEILNADGNCYMITIPLNVRYNISAGKKSNWFVVSGMSSYLMNKEYYDFTYRHPGGQPVTRGYEYKTAQKNWMTVINMNLGYERTFFKSFNYRIEPYFRLPVSGVGTGNLSLNSTGVYIGISKKF